MLEESTLRWKFNFNARKRKVMMVGKGAKCWKIDGEELEEIETFKYL